MYEHLEYFPYGETWVHNLIARAESLPFKFTSKELDPETGLYYHGHRYRDPRLGVWLSVDPLLLKGEYLPKPKNFDSDHDFFWRELHDEYEKLPGNGGVFYTLNLNAYHYAGDNPLIFIDPDGLVDINLFSKIKDAFLYKAAEAAPSPSKTFTVGAHGSPTRLVDQKGNPVSPRQLAEMIQKHPNYKPGMTVRLLSCSTGANPGSGKSSYAQKLADALGTRVEAPNTYVWYYNTGETHVAPPKWWWPSEPNYNKPGVFYYYEPRKKK